MSGAGAWDGRSPRALGEVDPQRLEQAVVWKKTWQLRVERKVNSIRVLQLVQGGLLVIILAKLMNWV